MTSYEDQAFKYYLDSIGEEYKGYTPSEIDAVLEAIPSPPKLIRRNAILFEDSSSSGYESDSECCENSEYSRARAFSY